MKTAPANQKFLPGARVRIADDLGPTMTHFVSGRNATVVGTYAQLCSGDNVDSYQLDIDGIGEVAWYHEHQLTATDAPVDNTPPEGETYHDVFKELGIEDHYEAAFNSNSRGELFHLADYVAIRDMWKKSGIPFACFKLWFEDAVEEAKREWERPESFYQHVGLCLSDAFSKLVK